MILGLLGGKPSRPSSLGHIGARVCVSGVRVGTLRFFGSTDLGPGSWCGIELDTPEGLNDGSVNGVRYFTCPPYHGLLAPESKVSYITDQDSGPHSFLGVDEDRTDSDSQISTPGSTNSGVPVLDSRHSSSAGSLIVRGVHDLSLQQSKHSSFELDESLGILTPDQMTDFAIERTPSCEELSSLMLQDVDFTDLDSSKRNSLEVKAALEETLKVPQSEEAHKENEDSRLSSLTVVNSDRSVQMDETDSKKSSDPVSSICPRSNRTPSVEDLPLDVEKKTAVLPNSFVTSITSITSLDNGYQGDGEWSRPASRGPDNSPSAHQKIVKPRIDPMTDSDFFTESDADGHEDCGGAHRKAQIIDGTLYGVAVNPGFTLPVGNNNNNQQRFSPTNEEMDSSGVYSDLDRNQPDSDRNQADDRPCSPEGSVRTVSSRSDQSLKKISPTSFTVLINEQVAAIKSLVASVETEPPPPRPLEEAPPPPVEESKPQQKPEPKKYKMPKRNVVSKIKTMISGSRKDENQENLVPSQAPPQPRPVKKGRWDDVMNKIAQDKGKTSPRLKEVKSKVFEGLSVQTQPLQRKSVSSRTLSNAQSVSTRSLRDIPNLKTKSRRCRLRGSETCLPGESQASSRNSSVSDVSQGTLTKASTPSSGRSSKKRDTGRSSPQTGRKPSTPPPANHKQPTGKNVQGADKGGQNGNRKTGGRRIVGTLQSSQKPTPLRDQNRVNGGVEKRDDPPRRSPTLEPLGPVLVTPPQEQTVVQQQTQQQANNNNNVGRVPPPPPPATQQQQQIQQQQQQQQLLQLQQQQEQQQQQQQNTARLLHAANGVEALATLVNYLVYTLDAFSTPKLKADLEKMKSEWIRAKLDLEEAQVSCGRLQDLLDEQKCEHERKMGTLLSEHREQLDNTVARHKQDLDEVTMRYNEKLAEMEKTFKEQELALKEKYENEIAELRRKHECDIERLSEEGKRAKSEASRLAVEVENSNNEVSRLQNLVEETRREADSYRQKLSLCVDKDTKGAFGRISQLESEVSSLRSVLELKSGELQEQRRKSEGWRRDAEQLPGVVTKVTTLQARLEDLQVRFEAKEAIEQRLLQENRSLMETVSEEGKQKKRLSLHNEELQWKLKQNTEVANAIVALYGSEANTPLANMAARMQRSPKSIKRLSFNSPVGRTGLEPEINGARVGGGGDSVDCLSGGSPPTSPKVKAVVEKNDSVAWVLDMDDPPEYVASRILRRAQSLRATNSPCPTPTHQSRSLPKKSSSTANMTGKKCTHSWPGVRGGEHVREEVILVRDSEGVLELFGPEDEAEIQIDAGRGDEETREMMRRAERRGSSGGLPKESGGEAMVSGEASEEEEDDDEEGTGSMGGAEDVDGEEEDSEEDSMCDSSASADHHLLHVVAVATTATATATATAGDPPRG